MPEESDADDEDWEESEVPEDSEILEESQIPEESQVTLRIRTEEKKSPLPQKLRSGVSKATRPPIEPPQVKTDDDHFQPDWNQPELWVLADKFELISHYRAKSSKANTRFMKHERQLPPDHHRDPEDQAFMDSLDSVNEPALNLAEEALVEAARQIQLQSRQHDLALAEANSKIALLERNLKEGQAVANETLREVKAGRVVANRTHDMVVNNTHKLDQCLGRPTLESWVSQGWDALMGKVPAEDSFFRPSTFAEWLNPQTFIMAVIWLLSWLDERSGSFFSRKLDISTPGFFKVVF